MGKKMGKYRWTVCALLFVATTINYLDRSVISLLKPYLEVQFKWSEKDYGYIIAAFQVSYALGMIFMGRLVDKIGTKLGYAFTAFIWSLAAAGHALAKSTFGFGIARSALGVSESGNFPAAIKTVSEWFPQKERAYATGIFNSGANIGAVAAPLTVPWIAANMGWQWAFILTGGIGFIWLIFWFFIYEIPSKNKRLSPEEFEYINSDKDVQEPVDEKPPSTPWITLLGFRQTWAFIIGKFLTDPIWWFFLFWLPAFLDVQYGIKGTAVSLPVATVYSMTTIGSIGGGWLPLYLVNHGWSVFKARKVSMLIYALCVVPVIFAQQLGNINMWWAVLIIGIAASAHQAWSANIFTTVSDMFPKKAVASVTGIGGMMGAFGGMLIALMAGIIFDHYKLLGNIDAGYHIMFLICAFAYLVAWIIMHFLVPKMKRVEI
jgi:MFS transporter, ACS family, aldohexuronate transporter